MPTELGAVLGHQAAPAAGRRGGVRRTGLLATAAVAVLAGLLIGRFVTYDGGRPDAPPPAAARATGDQVAVLEQAVAASPNDADALRQLAVGYIQKSAQTGDPAYYGLAEQALARATQAGGGDADTLVAEGALALARHRFGDALRLGQEALDRTPSHLDALAVVVDAQVELGRYDEAGVTLQRLLDRRPDLAALARVSYLRQLRGDLEGALVAMEQARAAGAASPAELPTVVAYLADLHLERGDRVAAGEAYAEVLAQDPDHVIAATGSARVLAAEGRTDDAIARLEGVVDRLPSPEAAVLLGDLRSSRGDVEGAAAAYDLVRVLSRLQQSSGQVVDLELALFEADHGDPAAAVDLARQAHESRATVYTADALAWALFRSGEATAALPYVDEALRLGTRDATMRSHAAAIFDALDDVDRARAELEVAAPGNAWGAIARRPEVRQLADRLGVDLPDSWAPAHGG